MSHWHISPAPHSLWKHFSIYRPVTERNTQESYCRHLIKAQFCRKHGIQREWSWLTSRFCSQRISAMWRREEATTQAMDLSRFALAQTALSATSLSLCTDKGNAKCQEEDRTYCQGNGNWSALVRWSPNRNKSSPIQVFKAFSALAVCRASGSPIYFNIKM